MVQKTDAIAVHKAAPSVVPIWRTTDCVLIIKSNTIVAKYTGINRKPTIETIVLGAVDTVNTKHS